MGRPARITTGTGPSRISWEYVRGRGVLRLTAAAPLVGVEVPFAELVQRLQVDTGQLLPARQFLLFAGRRNGPFAALGNLIGVFADERTARRAFERVRLEEDPTVGWAQLLSLDPRGRVRAIGWFGAGPHLSTSQRIRRPDHSEAVTARGGEASPHRRRRYPRLLLAKLLAALAAGSASPEAAIGAEET
jgi:hypothetical protein